MVAASPVVARRVLAFGKYPTTTRRGFWRAAAKRQFALAGDGEFRRVGDQQFHGLMIVGEDCETRLRSGEAIDLLCSMPAAWAAGLRIVPPGYRLQVIRRFAVAVFLL